MLVLFPMIDVPTIFDRLEGPAAVARLLNVKPSTASEMKRRRVIPVKYWPRLVKVCDEKGVRGVNYDVLVSVHSESADRP